MGIFWLWVWLVSSCSVFSVRHKNLEVVYEWNHLEFDYPNEAARENDIKSGNFKVGEVQPMDVDVYYKDDGTRVVYVTSPRDAEGTPVTLGTITNSTRNGNPIIAPYPSWDWQTDVEICKKHRMVSVYRVFIDKCHRIWILDNGKIGENQICPPLIIVFDLRKDELLRIYEIPEEQHRNKSLYVTPVPEILCYSNQCKNTIVYNADTTGMSLLVYDYKNNKSWRIDDETFYPDPKYTDLTIGGDKTSFSEGILGMALSPSRQNRKLYFHAISSSKENWIYTCYLRNQSNFIKPFQEHQFFHTFPRDRKTQSMGEAMDRDGNLYFGLAKDVKIVRWNSRCEYDRDNFEVVGDDKELIQFPSGIKVVSNCRNQEELWVFSTVYQKQATHHLSKTGANFRILYGRIDKMKILSED